MRFCPTCQRCFQAEVQFCLYDQAPTRDAHDIPLVLEGKYRLERLIAHGGMGSVYRGMHERLERPVAIKILRAEFLQDETVRARFHREALAAARLKHPNIIAVYDFGNLPNGSAYLVMELVEGRSLREEMRLNAQRHGQMRPERAAAILRQVCAGIEAAHQHGVIHRDLKPDNIMIEPLAANDFSGSHERVLVLDFGIAKLKQLEGAWQGLTEENVIIGTPNYISPEQCQGAPVESRSDVYALGVILYEMLTGRVPFNNVSTSAVLLSHLQDTPTPPTKYRPDLPPAVERVMLRALAKNPLQRFGSALQLADALTRALTLPQREEPEEIWPEELATAPPTPPESSLPDEPATRPRQPRTVAPPATYESYESHKSYESYKFSESEEPAYTETEIALPQLLIERPARRGFWLTMGLLVLVMIGFAGTFTTYSLPSSWRERGKALAVNWGLMDAPPQPTVTPLPVAENPSTQSAALQPAVADASTTPAQPLVTPASLPENLEAEVKTFYRHWAKTALDQDWAAHAETYAETLDYYRDHAVTRQSVMTRKQRVLSGLNRTYLKFAGSPQIILRERDGVQLAQLTFDKSWDLQRGQQRNSGKAQTQLNLERSADGQWQIVSERQLKLYSNTAAPEPAASAVAPKPKAAPKPAAKPAGRKPAAKVATKAVTRPRKVARPRP
jgi:serine/threonine protein kinase